MESGNTVLEKYDVIIIGKGPAGISAALYTVRANLKTLVVGADGGALAKTSKIENYFGFEMPVSGKELLENGGKQALRLGAEIKNAEVTAVEYGEAFNVKTTAGEYAAAAVLIATGQAPRRPELPGVKEFEGKGVSYCTTCDGFFYKNKSVGVLGNGNYAVQEAMELEPFTKDITIFTNGQEINCTGKYEKLAEKYKLNRAKVERLEGGEILNSIVLDGETQKLDGLFIASGTASSVDFAVKLGVAVKDGAIVVDGRQKTNLDGIFAAGDCTGGFRQIATAVGQGALAGKSIIDYVRNR